MQSASSPCSLCPQRARMCLVRLFHSDRLAPLRNFLENDLWKVSYVPYYLTSRSPL